MPGKRDHDPRLDAFAKRMRRAPTDAERKVWWILRDRRLCGFKFRRQHPIAGYIVDFICMGERLIIELDGGQHAEPEAVQYDSQRTATLNGLGFRVVRFWDSDVLKFPDAVSRTIYRELTEERRPSPQPSPGVPGEGEGAGLASGGFSSSDPAASVPSPGVPGEGVGPPPRQRIATIRRYTLRRRRATAAVGRHEARG